MSNFISDNQVVFHLSLNSENINRSVEFFSKVFGQPPAKQRDDYAKFELKNPPVTLSFEPGKPGHGGSLNHVGFKLDSMEQLVEYQKRIETAGIRSEREEGVECCYAKQTKFWLHDPDGNLWEMYVLGEDIEHRGSGIIEQSDTSDSNGNQHAYSIQPKPITCSTHSPVDEPSKEWVHRLGQEMKVPADIEASSLESVNLQGTFNSAGAGENTKAFLHELADRMAPGGRMSIHCLTSNQPLTTEPDLPGPASVVKYVPVLDELIDQLEAAGFESIELTKLGSRACFTYGNAELRETRIVGIQPLANADSDAVFAIYTGPFEEINLGREIRMQRGKKTLVDAAKLKQIKNSGAEKSIVILEQATQPVACGS